MIYVSNAFSLQMVDGNAELSLAEGSARIVRDIILLMESLGDKPVYAIGHQDTARMAAKSLNGTFDDGRKHFSEEEMFHRANIKLSKGDWLLVFQVVGGRLPEGCTELPEGVTCVWKSVLVNE